MIGISAATTTATTPIPHITARQPNQCPASTPIGTPSTIDTLIPAATVDRARPRRCSDESAPART